MSDGRWGHSREDMDSFTENPESGEVEHVVYLYPPDERERIAIWGPRNRETSREIVAAMNGPNRPWERMFEAALWELWALEPGPGIVVLDRMAERMGLTGGGELWGYFERFQREHDAALSRGAELRDAILGLDPEDQRRLPGESMEQWSERLTSLATGRSGAESDSSTPENK